LFEPKQVVRKARAQLHKASIGKACLVKLLGALKNDRGGNRKLFAGEAAAKIHCGQGLFIVGGTMRVKGKAEIRSICAVFREGASIANVIISR
jgi:hypothetical protein